MNPLRFAVWGQIACIATWACGCAPAPNVVPPAPVSAETPTAPGESSPPSREVAQADAPVEPPVVAPPAEPSYEPPVVAPRAEPTTGGRVAATDFARRQLQDYERTVLPPPKLYVTETGSHFHSADCPHVRKSRIPITPEKAQRYYERCTACGGVLKEHEVRVVFDVTVYDPAEREWTLRGTVNKATATAVVFFDRDGKWTARRLEVADEVVLRDDRTPSQSPLWDQRLRAAALRTAQRELQQQREEAERLRQARENAAAAKLQFAHVFLLQDRKDKTEAYLREILEDYADTQAAAGARQLLEKLTKAKKRRPGSDNPEGPPCDGAP